MSKYDAAISDYAQSPKDSPYNLFVAINTAHCHYKLKDYDKSLECFNQALKLNPLDGTALVGRAQVYVSIGKYELAQNDIDKVETVRPFESAVIGQCYARMGKCEKALTYYFTALKSKPNDVLLLHAIAEAYLCTKNYLKAIEYANRGFGLSQTIHLRIMSKFLLIVALLFNNQEYKEELRNCVEMVNQNPQFSVSEWSFGELITFMSSANLPPAVELQQGLDTSS